MSGSDTGNGLAGYGLPYWLDLPRPSFPTLTENLTADAVVIGAGLCGLKIAHALHTYGLKTVILEGKRVGEGASARNQGSVNHGAGISYVECSKRYGRAQAQAVWRLGLENHRLVQQQIDDYAIACDYEVGGYTFLARRDIPGWEATLAGYQHDCALLAEDGFAVAALDEQAVQAITGSALFTGGYNYLTDAQFHSGKYVLGLAQGVAQLPTVRLFEGSRVQRIRRQGGVSEVMTAQAKVSAPLVFLALNALAPQQVPDRERSLRAERGQVFVTEPLTQRPCTGSFGTAMAWWREIHEPDGRFRLLFGGGRKREEADSLFPQFAADGTPHPLLESDGFSPSVAHQQRLDDEFAKLFPHLAGVRITHRWGGLQSFTADDFPEVGLFDPERQIYGVAGFSGRGNCYSDVTAQYVVGRALGTPSPVEQAFGPIIEQTMPVRRATAAWGAWSSLYT
ncbi:MAG: FAD-binding oxidoreductase [Caldilineaceae bacterium]|nr:FAD-binding oxidoreductase [Caldilineaceae bacterium]